MKGITRARRAGQQIKGGGDQEASAPIETDCESTGHRKGGERTKSSKNKVIEIRSGSDRHRRPPGPFGSFEMYSEKSGMECLAGDREIVEVGVGPV
jgi:hypothetical protein